MSPAGGISHSSRRIACPIAPGRSTPLVHGATFDYHTPSGLWPKVLRAAQEAGIKYYLIEDESPAVLEQLPQSLRYLESIAW